MDEVLNNFENFPKSSYSAYRFEIKVRQILIELWISYELCPPGPSCSKLTMSLVNDSLKFTSSVTQIC